MATYTANYGLHQWVPEDNFQRTDFNTDLFKIDTALQNLQSQSDGKAEIIFGSYTGDGAASRTISLGFKPKWLLVMVQTGNMSVGYGGLAAPGYPTVGSGTTTAMATSSSGFTVYFNSTSSLNTNRASQYYHYIAAR